MRKLKRAVVKEELVALTGDIESALILNQFIYWSERVKDFDKFIMEEAEVREMECLEKPNIQLLKGWIYKDMEELKSEIMLSCSTVTIGRKLSKIVDSGWLDRRTNPEHKWDKRYQYRVNLNKIALDLYELGYALQDYKIDLKPLMSSNLQNEDSNLHSEASELQNEDSEIQNEDSNIQNEGPNLRGEGAISEITTEITTEINNNKGTNSNLKGTTEEEETKKDVVVENNKTNIDEKNIELAKKEIKAAYQELGVVSDYSTVLEILGENPSEADLERMENAITYVKTEYIEKDKKILNLPGLLRMAFEKGYRVKTIDPVSIRYEKQLAREREEWERNMTQPVASPEAIKNGLEMIKNALKGKTLDLSKEG